MNKCRGCNKHLVRPRIDEQRLWLRCRVVSMLEQEALFLLRPGCVIFPDCLVLLFFITEKNFNNFQGYDKGQRLSVIFCIKYVLQYKK